jgi:hypothetical protein
MIQEKRIRFILLYFSKFGLFLIKSGFKAFLELFSGFMNKLRKRLNIVVRKQI